MIRPKNSWRPRGCVCISLMVIYADNEDSWSRRCVARFSPSPVASNAAFGYWPSRCNLVMYEVLTWFQADMYFSMHWVKQVCSPLDSEEPGFGTHFWKQCSLIFWRRVSKQRPGKPGNGRTKRDTYLYQLSGVGHGILRPDLLDHLLLNVVGVHVGGELRGTRLWCCRICRVILLGIGASVAANERSRRQDRAELAIARPRCTEAICWMDMFEAKIFP